APGSDLRPALTPRASAAHDAPAAPAEGASAAAVAAVLAVITEKTGYPAEMLNLDMSLEWDLGIDSIKRVEIFSELQARFPAVRRIDNEMMATIRTLAEIVKCLVGDSPGADQGASAQSAAAPVSGTPSTSPSCMP